MDLIQQFLYEGQLEPWLQDKRPILLHVVFSFDVGGIETGLVNLINQFPDNRYKHAIVSLTSTTEFRKRLQGFVPIFCFGKKPGKDLGLYWTLFRFLRQLKPAIIHTNNLSTLETHIPAWFAGVKGRVHTDHGWDVHDLNGDNKKYQKMRKVLSWFAGDYIAVSQQIADYLQFKVGIAKARIFQIYNGVNLQRFSLQHDTLAPWPSGFADSDSIVIGSVGRMAEVKNHMCLVQAFHHLCQQVPQYQSRLRLVILGDGKYYQPCVDYLQQHGLQQQSWLPGNRDDVAQILPHFSIFTLPSLTEGIPYTVLEAMGAHLPTVASRVGGLPELIDGHNGCLVPPDDAPALAQALQQYVENPDLIAQQGDVARQYAEQKYAIEVMMDAYLQLYNKQLAKA